MEPRERVSLLLATALVASLLIVIGTTLGSGRDSPPGVMKMKVLRRKNQLHRKPRPEEIAAFQEGTQRERTFKAREFKDMPLAIRQVRNLQSDTWHKDLEIEVKNISDKPIYCILAYLIVPKEGVEREAEYGIHLVFGEDKYIDVKRIGDPQDPHLDPGHTFTFTIPEKLQIGLKVFHERHPELTKKLELHFAVISFGDGTGFEVQKPTDHRTKKADSSNKKNNHANRLGSSAVRAPPQDGCGPCSRYVFDPVPYHICYGRITNADGAKGHL
jgi:hypothetical protein